MKWISVKDKLPKRDSSLIVYDAEYGIAAVYYTIYGIFEGDGCFPESESLMEYTSVLYWMPLDFIPSPPITESS